MHLVSATNRDLGGDVSRGLFRSDLFFRLDGVTLAIPPLRERREQIGPLALSFLRAGHARQTTKTPLRLAHDLLARLEAHTWPGNVRELKAVVERALLLSCGGEITTKHLTWSETKSGAEPTPSDKEPPALSPSAAAERQSIVDVLEACAGNQTRAAAALGIARSTLVVKLALYRIPRPRR